MERTQISKLTSFGGLAREQYTFKFICQIELNVHYSSQNTSFNPLKPRYDIEYSTFVTQYLGDRNIIMFCFGLRLQKYVHMWKISINQKVIFDQASYVFS